MSFWVTVGFAVGWCVAAWVADRKAERDERAFWAYWERSLSDGSEED